MLSSQLTLCYKVTCLKTHHEYLKLSYSSDHPKTQKIFYCRNGVLATNIISTASAPHQRCQHPTKGALLLAKASGLTTFLALLIAVRRTLLTTSALLPDQLLTRLSLEISPLASTQQVGLLLKMKLHTSCASPMLMHFSRLPRILPVISSEAIFHICHQAGSA